MVVNGSKCQAITYGGRSCQARARASGWCFFHDPLLVQERKEAARKGGIGKSKAARLAKLMPNRLLPVWEKLNLALTELQEGRMEPRVATAMAALAGAMVRVVSVGEIEARLRNLENIWQIDDAYFGKAS